MVVHILNKDISYDSKLNDQKHAGKQWVAGSIPGGGIYSYFEFTLSSRCSQLIEVHTNEIKHDIHSG